MSFNNIFTLSRWYTDTVDVYRCISLTVNGLTTQKREQTAAAVPCRVYASQKDGPIITDTAARERSADKLACGLGADVRAGDELLVTRGGALGHKNAPERYFAGAPQRYYDPVGGALTGLEHQEIGLLLENIVG